MQTTYLLNCLATALVYMVYTAKRGGGGGGGGGGLMLNNKHLPAPLCSGVEAVIMAESSVLGSAIVPAIITQAITLFPSSTV